MRVLLLHNYYGSSAPSGENQVFELERDLLTRSGHTVFSLTRNSDTIRNLGRVGSLLGAISTPWNPTSARAVRREVKTLRPDVVHAHNTFPLLSPSVFHAVGTRAARVLTLHNYRLFCPAAIPMRDGRPCTACIDSRSVLPSLWRGCYRGSRLATLPLAANVALCRLMGTWERQVDAFIALTEFQKELLVAAGLPAERVFVKPNFYPGNPVVRPWAERNDAVVFAGRIAEEKGVRVLVEAWTKWGPSAPLLRIIGDGPLRPALEALARNGPARKIEFLGQKSPSEAAAEIGAARLLVVPSTWFEGFPLVLREAFAFGTPVAVSRVGSLPELVKDGAAGLVFEAGNAAALLEVVRAAWISPGQLPALSDAARARFEAHYSEGANLEALMRIYGAAVESLKARRP